MELLRHFPGGQQSLRIEAGVLRCLRKYRQTRLGQSESGGQLFGTVTPSLVTVSHVARPHRSDQKARTSFRSDPERAQAAIQRFARRGLLYLGEWHTHAEPIPRPSFSDEEAMRSLFLRSQLSTSALLLLIIGYGNPDGDVGVWYIDSSGGLHTVD